MLTQGRGLVLFLLVILTSISAYFAVQVRVEQDTRSMVSQNSEQVATYAHFREAFGNDEDLLLSVTHPRLLSGDTLALIDTLTRRIAAIDGVTTVLSLSNAKQLVADRYGAQTRPLLPPFSAPLFTQSVAAALQFNPHYEGLLIAADHKTAGLLIALQPTRSRRQIIDEIRNLMAATADRAELHLTGIGVQQSDVAAFIQRDQKVILPLILIVLMVMLATIFQRVSGVLLPLLATGASLIWTLGSYVLCGFELNTITSLLSPVVMVLAVSGSIHLYSGWRQLQGEQGERINLLAAKVEELFIPCFFTALTTALGLLSLTISGVPAVRQFGLFAALGVMLSFLAALTLVPIGLSFLPLPERSYRTGKGVLRHTLQWATRLTINHPRAIMAMALILLGVALSGLPRLQNNTNLISFFAADTPLAIDTAYIDQHLAGVNLLDFMVTRSDALPLESMADYERIEKFEKLALHHEAVAGSLSVLTLLRPLHRAESAAATLSLPDNDDDLRYELELLESAREHSSLRRFLTTDRKTARVTFRLHDMGSRTAASLVATLQQQGKSIFGADYRLQPTGSFYRMTDDSNRLVSDLIKSFSLSLALVTLSILLLLRSLWLTLLSLIPNIIPILWTAGLMGYAKIDLSTGTAMIGAVVIGLAVDDTIHYLVHYRRVFNGNVRRAIILTTTRIGRALISASLVLAFGFWVGCLGSFKPTIYFSLLVGGTMIGALICDLLVLPACLVLGTPPRQRSRA